MKYFVIFTAILGTGLMWWYLTPPTDVVGSFLPMHPERRMWLLREEERQNRDMGFI